MRKRRVGLTRLSIYVRDQRARIAVLALAAAFTSGVQVGGWLLVGVVRVMRATSFVKPAWSVYKYSLLYLALLFAAMVVDRAVA